MEIIQVNHLDSGGGAGTIAHHLSQALNARGHRARLVVGEKIGLDSDVMELPNTSRRSSLGRRLASAACSYRDYHLPAWGKLQEAALAIGEPKRWISICRGREDFDFPGTSLLVEMCRQGVDILHLHNLHGGYFDFRLLPDLSVAAPTVLTLHDLWILGGHCAHPLECQEWKEGCKVCSHLALPPSIRRDGAAFNWKRKRQILSKSRLFVVTPCRWLMDHVRLSGIGVAGSAVIPNGVDLEIFRPGNQEEARRFLGLPGGVVIVLCSGWMINRNPWKDWTAVEAAFRTLAAREAPAPMILVALGGVGSSVNMGVNEIRYVPFEPDPLKVAKWYQACDLFLHASRADTFPTAVLEAQACGKPVVATSLGGIPEQVENGRTGLLVRRGDGKDLAEGVGWVLSEKASRVRMGMEAADHARRNFSSTRMVDAYLQYYEEVRARTSKESHV